MNVELKKMVAEFGFDEPVQVTRPTMPDLDRYTDLLKGIWDRKWLTNDGELHHTLESRLGEYLGAQHLSLFCNGTIALAVALQALRINSGEVITTPFTFPATPHVLYWNRITPVFCDIEPETLNIDPRQIEAHISPDTKAILPVHVYGNPCDVDAIQSIADRHGLYVIYDAAHAFGVRRQGESILAHGDMSILSFHATKLFTTVEGGAIVSRNEQERERINFLKNFGIADEETVIGPGINGKMNELQAAFGLLQLEQIQNEIARRRNIAAVYQKLLRDIPGIRFFDEMPGVEHNYAYFPILVDEKELGLTRDALYENLKRFNVFSRKYFYPLCSQYPCYASLPSSRPGAMPVAEHAAECVLCLPICGSMEPSVADSVSKIIGGLHELARSGVSVLSSTTDAQ